MSSRSTVRLREILQTALERPASARPAFVADACGGDAGLRSEVESLLAASEGSGAFLSAPEAWHCGAFPNLVEAPGTEVGRYTLERLIGEGGFGAVFAARQEHPIKRTVALKIIKLGMDTRQVVARFHAERQALAMMDHAGIAKVYDAGATDAGRPYFVMELVDGVPITQYCDGRRLDIRRRLSLFVAVCEAVQHAHQKGIIHRDLKPTNILVTDADGRPGPKVIDFGIARAMQGRLTDHTLWTEQRQCVGTPQYMSPEQAGRGGADADTRSDVYSLGVLLYELLTGATPFDGRELREEGAGEVERVIREVEPPRPSARVGGMDPAVAAQVAGGRDEQPARLARRLKGELDWVVMKCLEKDRTRRYQTAAALADDLRRHLADEPVQAAAPSTWYRLRKFARRNRTRLAAAAAMAVVLVAGVTGSAVGMLRARAAQERARRDAEQVVTVTEFLSEMFRSARPAQGGGRQVTLVEVLDRAAALLPEKFHNQPDAEIRARKTLAFIYGRMGIRPAALQHITAAYDLARRTYGEDNEATLEVASFLSYFIMLDAPTRAEWEKGAAIARRTHETALRKFGEVNRASFTASHFVGNVLLDKETKEAGAAAEAIWRRMIEIQREHPDFAGLMGMATPYQGLAFALQLQGKLADAEPYAREALRLDLADGWRGTRSHAHIARRLARILRDQGKLKDAAGVYREILALENELGHRYEYIEEAANEYVDVLLRLNDYDAAVEFADHRVKLAAADAPPDPALVARRTARLAELRDRAARPQDGSTSNK